MNAENKTTPHNRTIRLTNIPLGQHCRHSEMQIKISYVESDGARIDLAVALDHVIIPAIIDAINKVP